MKYNATVRYLYILILIFSVEIIEFPLWLTDESLLYVPKWMQVFFLIMAAASTPIGAFILWQATSTTLTKSGIKRTLFFIPFSFYYEWESLNILFYAKWSPLILLKTTSDFGWCTIPACHFESNPIAYRRALSELIPPQSNVNLLKDL